MDFKVANSLRRENKVLMLKTLNVLCTANSTIYYCIATYVYVAYSAKVWQGKTLTNEVDSKLWWANFDKCEHRVLTDAK